MIDLNLLRETPDIFRSALQARQMDPQPVDQILELDGKRRLLIQEVEALKAERNAVSKEIGRLKDPAARQVKIDAMRQVGDRISQLDEQLRLLEAELEALLATVPNLPDPLTPYGKGEQDNVVVRSCRRPS